MMSEQDLMIKAMRSRGFSEDQILDVLTSPDPQAFGKAIHEYQQAFDARNAAYNAWCAKQQEKGWPKPKSQAQREREEWAAEARANR